MIATNAQTQTALFLGSASDPMLPERIRAGQHPRVEYLELINSYGCHPLSGTKWSLAAMARADRSLRCALTTGEDIGFPIALIQRLTGGSLPLGIITHGSYLGSRKAVWVLRLLRGLPSLHFLCLSDSLRQRLIEVHHVPKDRVHTIGYGVDTHFFQPQPCTDLIRRQVASAGMANRDYQTLAAAASGQEIEVKIAADSAWFRADLDISGQDLPPNVEARSYGNYVGLRQLYAESACVVVPLYPAVHACGYAVIAEAMAMGKPVITTRIAGQSDYIREGETGFTVPPGDPLALRARILELLDNPALAARMGQNARCLIEEKYTLEDCNSRVAAALGLDGAKTT